MLNVDTVGNITFNVAALIISLTCIVYTLMMQSKPNLKNKLFFTLVIIVMIDAFSGMGVTLVSQLNIAFDVKLILYHVCHFSYFFTHFAIAPILALYIILYCGVSFRFSIRSRWFLSAPFILIELLTLFNPALHLIYTIDSDLIFHRVSGIYLAYLISAFYMLFAIAALYLYWNAFNNLKKFAITYFFVIVIAGTIIQMLFINIRCELMCEAIGLMGIMVIFENDDDGNDLATGTFNRSAFLRDAKIYLKYGRNVWALCVRIENADLYRKITGYEEYERILYNIGMFLTSINPRYDVYRVSNSCFYIFCPEVEEVDASLVSEIIFDRFSKEWIHDGGSFLLKALVIEINLPHQLSNLDYLLLLSDSSMSSDEDKSYYKIEDLDFLFRRAAVEKALRRGIEAGSFDVYYIPIYLKDGLMICGAESTLRFYDSEIGVISPDEFMPIAIETGIITELGWFNIEEVFHFLGGGITEEMGLDFVSINISARQIIESDFSGRIKALLDKYEIDASRVSFNLTEATATANKNVLDKVIGELSTMGIQFYMDDYGKELFGMRAMLPAYFDGARINASLIEDASKNSQNKIIMDNRINILNQTKKKIVIKGVDDVNTLELLTNLKVEYLQGLYFSDATSKRDFIAILRATEMARMEERRARAASEAKSSFLANMSHEIRTPINAVLGMNEVILRECKDDSILEYARNIEGAGRTLLSLINDILDFSKIEAGSMEINESEYEVSSLLNDVYNMVNIRAEKNNLTLEFDIDEDFPNKLYGDEMRIRQIMVNLLNNGVKYTTEGTVTLKLSFTPSYDDFIDLRIVVKDTGIGIKKEDLSSLFDKFKRLDIDKNKTVEGSGLGLAITSSLIELMHGSINVDSVYGSGSTFTVTLPQKMLSSDKIGDFKTRISKLAEKRKYRQKFIAPEANILVVDDTPMNHVVITELLKHTKVNITSVKSGLECLEYTKNNKYDIIFLDYRMPGMNGTETLNHLKEDEDNANLNTPVIVLTANAIYGAREAFLKEGFDDYLSKPIDSEKLEETIMHFLPSEKITEMVDEDELVVLDENSAANWINKLTLIDSKAGLKNCGSNDSYLNIIKAYYQSIKTNMSNISNALETENYKDYTSFVHSLKSTSRTIGAMELSELAKEMEAAGNEGNIAFIKKMTPQLLEMYSAVEYELSGVPEIADTDDSKEEDKPAISNEMLQDAFNSILEVSEKLDYDTLQYIVEQLKQYSLSPQDNDIIKLIEEKAYRLDWDEIKTIAKERLTKEINT